MQLGPAEPPGTAALEAGLLPQQTELSRLVVDGTSAWCAGGSEPHLPAERQEGGLSSAADSGGLPDPAAVPEPPSPHTVGGPLSDWPSSRGIARHGDLVYKQLLSTLDSVGAAAGITVTERF